MTLTHAERAPLWELLRPPIAQRAGGLANYRLSWEDGYGAIVAAGGPEPRPCMLRMGGKALEAWRADHTDRDLLYHLAFNGAHCTRIDLARDTSGPWTPGRLWSFVTAGRYVSAWRDFKAESDASGRVLVVRCGSRSSEVYLRVYDKRAEMESRGERCPFARLTRWELEIKGDRATAAFDELVRSLPHFDETTGEESWRLRGLHSSWLAARLDLTERPVDRTNKNQTKARPDPAWTAFVATSSDSVLAPEIDTRDVERQAAELGDWLVRGVAGSLAVVEALGGREAIDAILRLGRQRMSVRHRMLIDRCEEARRGLASALETRGVQSDSLNDTQNGLNYMAGREKK